MSRIAIGETGLVIVRADERNWSLVRERVSAKGVARDETLGYFGQLEAAAKKAAAQLAADEAAACERFELGQLIAAVDRAGRLVAEACAGRDET